MKKNQRSNSAVYTASRFSRPPSRLAAKHSRRLLTMAQLWGEEVHPLHRLAERLGDKSRVWGLDRWPSVENDQPREKEVVVINRLG